MQPPDANGQRYRCRAVGCQHVVLRTHLMCNGHWRMVPVGLRREVYAAWKVLRRSPCMHNSRAYLKVVGQAVDAVEAKQMVRLANASDSTPQLF